MLSDIVRIASDKATEVAKDQILAFANDNPGPLITEEMKTLAIQRAMSQLIFKLNTFKVREEVDLEEQFEAWFKTNEEEPLRKAVNRCLKEEIGKISKDEDESADFLTQYLRDNKRRTAELKRREREEE